MTPESSASIAEKELRLKALISGYGSLAVAYSGGVDSTYLADVAHETLGTKAVMVLADSPSIPRSEVSEATRIAKERGWHLEIIETKEFENEEYLKNDGRRCYFCKAELFNRMRRFASDHGVSILAYGAIVDDLLDPTRLGAVAAREYQVVAPLQEAGLSKENIRMLSRARGLPTSEKASFACLASRFPTGTRVSATEMSKVERAEEVLRSAGFHQFRARHHGDICRIEVDLSDLPRFLDAHVREALVRDIKGVGYRFVALDLAGYRTGSSAGLG